jgi:sugar phosphate isomerase/epimerase
MKSAVTLSLVPEAASGPFLFHGDAITACATARELGFDGLELFAPGPEAMPAKELKSLLDGHGLTLAAVGTGAGWVQQKLSLTSTDAAIRRKAIDFIAALADYGAEFGAPAIIGSMQGRWDMDVTRDRACDWLAEALAALSSFAIVYEPLNRYETNLFNTLADAEAFLDARGLTNVKLLADLFHMNIEEAVIADSLNNCKRLGHVHLADSNRGPAGSGHTDFAPIGKTLKAINYAGFVSAEAFPKPDSRTAATMTIQCFREHFLR